jgi:hypothetical protein
MLKTEMAYIAVDKTGYVDGACFTPSVDAEEWASDMRAQGFEVKTVERAKAKELLFTQLPNQA